MSRNEPPASPASRRTPVAFATLLDRWQVPLLHFVRELVGDAEEARDLTQDVFYDAWRAAQSGQIDLSRDESTLRSWVFRAGYHRAMSALRRRRVIRWEALESDDEGELPLPDHAAPFEERVIEHATLAAALATLSASDAACLILIVVQGFTPAEVAAIVGKTPAAVAKQFARARLRLHHAYLAQDATPHERSLP
jgi:RNA polymerase sigma factor (sigma-70 family)